MAHSSSRGWVPVVSVWEAAIESVLKHEGGLVDHPNDPGGITNYGISLRSHPHLGREGIKNLTRAEAVRIYRESYWSRVPDGLADDVRWFAFDIAVHSGVGRMREWLAQDQTLLGLAAIRLKFLASLSTWPTFGKGWTRRVASVLEDIRAWQAARPGDGDAPPHAAHTVVLHGFPLALRWAVLTRSRAVLRGAFVWRSRGGKLDVRNVR